MTGRRSGLAGLLLLAVSTVSMLGLHRARPDLDMVATPLSFYSRGAGSWMLAVSLVASGLAVLIIALSIHARATTGAGITALAIAGGGMLLAAIFIADPWFPWERMLTTRGWVHAIAVGVAVTAFATGAMLISRDAGLVDGDPVLRRLLRLLALAFLGVFGFFGALTVVYLALGRSPGFLGLAERLMMALAVAWLALLAPVPKSLTGGG